MTNGDKLQQILNIDNNCIEVWGEDGKIFFSVTQEWWNSESDNKGEWQKSDIPESMLCKCSKCGWQLGAYTHNFCANCGADMRTETQYAKDILHKAIDNTPFADDVYPNIREKLHKAVEDIDMRGKANE